MSMSYYNIDNLRESMVKILGSDEQAVSGSGFIIRPDGYLITCHHVIYLLDTLKVKYQGQIYECEWCEELSNPEVDIAILKIDVEDAKAVPIINPQYLSISVTVYGFPPSQKKYFPEGFDVSAQKIRPSAPIKALLASSQRQINFNNPWNKLPNDESVLLSHRIDAKVDSGTSGGAVFAEDLGGVVGIIKCSDKNESYVIRWDNITESLDKLGLEPHKNAVCRFLKEIENNFKYDKLLHIPEQPIILKDQYIPIQVTLERKYTHAVETTWGYAESEAELKQAYALKRLEESQPSQVDWKEAKKQHQRIMVLADPGMGKSTLLRREACLTAQEERQSLKNNTKKLEEVVFPLFLRLSDLAETPEEIIDAIPVLLQRDYSETATQVMELLREKLKVGKCLLLLDALDEVPTEHRKRLIEKLNRFAQRKPPCPLICTSRIVGYSGASVQGAKEVEIVPFSQKQIEQYIETWFRNAAGYLNDDTVSASSLIRELRNKPQIRGLAQNPLLLSLICSLYQEKGLTLPARRCQVYEPAVSHMLGKWSKNRNPELNDAWIDAKTELLEELAYQFSCDGKEIFTLRELRKTIDEYLRSGNASSDFDNLSASQLISELSEQDGILQKLHKDGDQYLFLHRTFQEYLTACYLKHASNGIALAKEHFWEYDWHETLSLLAGLMGNPVPLLQAITAQKDDIFSTLLLLAGRCIAECQENSHPLIAEIIDRIYKFWQSYPSAGFIESIVVAIGQVNSYIFQYLQKALNQEDSFVRKQAIEILGKIGTYQVEDNLIAALNHKDRFWPAAEALGQMGNPEIFDVLKSALNHEDRNVKNQAAAVLGQIGTHQAVAALISVLKHEDASVRTLAAMTLKQISDSDAVPALISTLNDDNKEVKFQAGVALAWMGNSQAIPVLISVLKDQDEDSGVRGWAAIALGKIDNRKAIAALISILRDQDEDSNVRGWAARTLRQVDTPTAVAALISALKDQDEDSDVREGAAVALGEIGNPQAVAALRSVLNDNNNDLKWTAAIALSRISKLQVVEILIPALNHWNPFFSWGVIEGLSKIGNHQAVAALISILSQDKRTNKWKAAKALSQIGTPAILEKLIQLPEIDIRDPDIFSLARTLAVRFSKEKLPFIPVYPELVAHKQ
jgi:HEAT repeat protein/phage terminase Nu1 subunit (DNA packaging protein)